MTNKLLQISTGLILLCSIVLGVYYYYFSKTNFNISEIEIRNINLETSKYSTRSLNLLNKLSNIAYFLITRALYILAFYFFISLIIVWTILLLSPYLITLIASFLVPNKSKFDNLVSNNKNIDILIDYSPIINKLDTLSNLLTQHISEKNWLDNLFAAYLIASIGLLGYIFYYLIKESISKNHITTLLYVKIREIYNKIIKNFYKSKPEESHIQKGQKEED